MKLLAHRGHWTADHERNTLEAFERAFRSGWGVETDVRDLDGELVVSHDLPRTGALPFAEVVRAHARHPEAGELAVNVKADGLQDLLLQELDPAVEWFAFDMSVPDALACLRRGLPSFTRHSDVEPEPALYDRSEGVWLDDFGGGWIREEHVARHLESGKRVAVVSPELHGRDHAPVWAEWSRWSVWADPAVLLCTDLPGDAEETFA
jgi:glycerophosphoryl diester phosphodiesterase